MPGTRGIKLDLLLRPDEAPGVLPILGGKSPRYGGQPRHQTVLVPRVCLLPALRHSKDTDSRGPGEVRVRQPSRHPEDSERPDTMKLAIVGSRKFQDEYLVR